MKACVSIPAPRRCCARAQPLIRPQPGREEPARGRGASGLLVSPQASVPLSAVSDACSLRCRAVGTPQGEGGESKGCRLFRMTLFSLFIHLQSCNWKKKKKHASFVNSGLKSLGGWGGVGGCLVLGG